MTLRIKEIAKEKNLTLDQMAAQLGITAATLSRNISGNPTLETLSKIATVLEMDVSDLFERKNVRSLYEKVDGTYVKIGYLEN